MSFVKRIIGPDEKLIGVTGAHWIYGAQGILWLGSMMLFGFCLRYYAGGFFNYLFMDTGTLAINRIADALFWLPVSLGAVMFSIYFFMMIGPEIALTSKRVIYKRGIIFIDMKEVDLEEIKAAHVDNGFLGRFLNYGYVVFDARFVTGMDLPAISKPYRFVKALNDARSHLKEDSMTVVLECVGDAVKQEVAAQTQPAKVEVAKPAKTSPLERLQKGLGGREGPVVFDNPLLQREKNLREKIKDNFSSTTH